MQCFIDMFFHFIGLYFKKTHILRTCRNFESKAIRIVFYTLSFLYMFVCLFVGLLGGLLPTAYSLLNVQPFCLSLAYIFQTKNLG